MNIIKQVAEHIEFLGFGTVSDAQHSGNIFWGLMPDAPDDCICVNSTDSGYGGSDDGARIQVVVRGKNTKNAYETSQAIAEALAEYVGYLAGDGAFASVTVLNASCGLGADAKKREMYSSNLLVYYCNF